MIDQERMYKVAMIEVLSDLLEDANGFLRELIDDYEHSYSEDKNLIKPEEC